MHVIIVNEVQVERNSIGFRNQKSYSFIFSDSIY